MDNPYAPPSPASEVTAAVSDRALAEPRRSEAPRWLAVLVSLISGQKFPAVGLVLLGQRRRALIWLSLGVLVMGDNRHNSNDSRVWGTVPDEMVRGLVQFVWMSEHAGQVRWDRIGKPID